MKKLIIALFISFIFNTGCSDKCIEHVYHSTVVIDVSDTIISNHFKKEITGIIEKLTPSKMNRCEGIRVDLIPIGASIENQGSAIFFPESGLLNKSIGNYDLADSNTSKLPSLQKGIENALGDFRAVGNNQSQVFYTIAQILNTKSGRLIIYTDLLEYYGITFYKTGYDFEKTYTALLKKYSMSSAGSKFNGTISLVSPMNKNQDAILYAREFYKYYFNKIGISQAQYEFIGSISQTKF